MQILRCACGGVYRLVPDEDASSMPPSFTAKLFHCSTCDSTDWQEAEFFNLEEWPEDLWDEPASSTVVS